MDGLTKSPLIEPRAHVIQEAMKIPFYDELHWIVFLCPQVKLRDFSKENMYCS